MGTSRSDAEPPPAPQAAPPDEGLSEDEVVAIAAFLLFERHENAARYGAISSAVEAEPAEENDG